MIVEMRKVRKTKRHCNSRKTRKRGGKNTDVEIMPWNDASINQYRQHRNESRNNNINHIKFIENISKKKYDTGLEFIRRRIYALMKKKEMSANKNNIQKQIDELQALGQKIKKNTFNKMVLLNEAVSEFPSNDERRKQKVKIMQRIDAKEEGTINNSVEQNLANHNATTEKIRKMSNELQQIKSSNQTGRNEYELQTQLNEKRKQHLNMHKQNEWNLITTRSRN